VTPAGAFLLGCILTGLLWLWSWHIGAGLWADLKTRWSERGGRHGGHPRAGRPGFRRVAPPLTSHYGKRRLP
jgi:hypothetical protein